MLDSERGCVVAESITGVAPSSMKLHASYGLEPKPFRRPKSVEASNTTFFAMSGSERMHEHQCFDVRKSGPARNARVAWRSTMRSRSGDSNTASIASTAFSTTGVGTGAFSGFCMLEE